MNKAELIDAVSSSADLSKSAAGKAVDAVVSTITQSLKSGNQVTIVGFGTFLVREKSARTGRNPRTGETIQIAAGRAAGFKPGKALKDALNADRASARDASSAGEIGGVGDPAGATHQPQD